MTVHQNEQWLEALLELSRKPVGVKFLLTKSDYERFQAAESENRMSYCTFVRRASEGTGAKFHYGNMACAGGAAALGLAEVTESMISGERRLSHGAYKDLCICRKVSKKMTYCAHSAYGVAVLPLSEFTSPPDVVILICNPFNAMRIAQGYAFNHGHADDICLSGMQAICQECTSYPYETDCLNLSLMCSGTRMLAGWKKDEMAAGMPYHIFEEVVDGLQATVNPLERDPEKRRIADRLAENNIGSDFTIMFGHNYDDNAYTGGPAGRPKE